MRILDNMTVNLKCGARIGVPKLPLDNFRRCAGVEQESRVGMTERVEPTTWKPECIEDCPQVIFHDLV